MMTYPTVEYSKYYMKAGTLGTFLAWYGYNWHVLSFNQRLKNVRYLFPVMWLWVFSDVYSRYNQQISRATAFDEYCQLRSAELVDQYSFLLGHEGNS